MLFTTCLYFFIAVAVCLYLYVDGKQLVTELLTVGVSTLILCWVVLVFTTSVVFHIMMTLVGPVLRVIFRLDTLKITHMNEHQEKRSKPGSSNPPWPLLWFFP